jgi:Uma2 family endonuclease
MSASPDLLADFRELERRLTLEPEGVQAEIVRGIYLMSPRPRPKHGNVQGRLVGELQRRFGEAEGGAPPDWYFVVEPELRSERTFSRLVPDLAGWRRSASGWPDPEATPVTLVPDWVAEILSPSTAATDRSEKLDAYGSMGVGWVWLVDPDRRNIETFANVRGRTAPGRAFGPGAAVAGDPFGEEPLPVDSVFG